jgi:14-3-3 protein epsilon
MSEQKNYTREECIFLAKLYEKAEKFPEMVKFINKFAELDPKLSKDERNILESGFKNLVSDKRASWRFLNNMEKREEKKNSSQIAYIREIKENIEKELNQIYDEIDKTIDKYLMPNASDSENKAFYLRLKGDYYRYKCEFSIGKEFDEGCAKVEKGRAAKVGECL